jgi:hypothetical protein
MNFPEVCPACSSASCVCSPVVSVVPDDLFCACGWCCEFPQSHLEYCGGSCAVLREKYDVICDEDGELSLKEKETPELRECLLCSEDKPPAEFEKYEFTCSCVDVNSRVICDECVDKIRNKKHECPTCRKREFSRLIRRLLGNDFKFSFSCDLPRYAYDGDFNALSWSQKDIETKPHLKECFDIFQEKNLEFYDKVFNKMEDDKLTRGTQAYLNIWEFLNETIFKHNHPNDTNREKFKRFFILQDDYDVQNITELNSMKMYDFMDDFNPNEDTVFIYINTYFDRWEKYRFVLETEERIIERIEDEVTNGICYHNLDYVIDYLRPENRDAFCVNSHFWAVARENEMNSEILALIDRHDYQEHLLTSFKFFSYCFMNGDEGFCDIMSWDDHNGNYTGETDGQFYYCLEHQEVYNL